MPNYIIFDPSSTPVANRVTSYRTSFPQERETELGLNFLRDPDVTGIDLENAKVSAGAVVALSAGDLASIAADRQSAQLTREKTFLGARLSNPRSDARLLMEALAEVTRQEINALRAAVIPSLPNRTQAQMRNAILTEFQNRVDALT